LRVRGDRSTVAIQRSMSEVVTDSTAFDPNTGSR
jgi:hypothetical protein